jgi:glycerol-3-phosphate O-acyltransferase
MSEALNLPPEPAPEPAGSPAPPLRPHPSSMAQRLGRIHSLVSRWAFAFVHVDPRFVERVQELQRRGTIVYVMRNRSVADYLLVNFVFLRENLPLPQFSNGVAIGWFRSLQWIVGRIGDRLVRGEIFGHRARTAEDLDIAIRLASEGHPMLFFLRARPRGFLGLFRLREALESTRVGEDFLGGIVRVARGGERDVFVVPLALFRGRGYRRRTSRLATLVYSVQEAPSDLKKLVQFLFNRRDLSLTIGEEIPLRTFLDKYGRERDERLVRRLTRALYLFLVREERVVWGPPLLPKHRVGEIVLGAPELRALIARLAVERKVPARKIEREARTYFDEIASNFNGTYFAILAFVFRRIWNRIFRGVEITGLDRVADRIRQHPVVLVPCHRSHFDYLILSYIFHGQFLSPPHIAAGINLSFFPLGMLFRGAGAYFIRRSFDDNELYKVVFRQYLTYLIREGYTQEFFIEGGRSRSGKILTPKLGMLSAIVNAFLRGIRRDLYLVPVSISYERLVEEEAYKQELLGEEKPKETLLSLLRARSVLRRNYGKAYVNFGEPISLDGTLGELRARFGADHDHPGIEEERRRFTLKLGFRILREVNAASVVTAPSIAATVLLSNPYSAIRYPDFLRAAHLLLDHATAEGASFTRSLEQDRETFRDTLSFLQTSGLVVSIPDPDGEILHLPDDKRINLDFYKNNAIHLFVLLALLSHSLVRGVARDDLKDDLWWWLDLFRNEFVLPEREMLTGQVGRLLERFRKLGILEDGASRPEHPLLRATASILQNFREAYWVALRVIAGIDGDGMSEKVVIDQTRRLYNVNLLLGVLRKPEGNTIVTLENALRRFQEMGYVSVEGRGRGARELWVTRGPAFEQLVEAERRLGVSATLRAPRI